MIESIGIVGAGTIAKFHIEAFVAAGFQINGICATPGSKRSKSLATKYEIPHFANISQLVMNSKSQAYLICVDERAVNSVLSEFSAIDLPLLIEKPGPSINDKNLSQPFVNKHNWYIAYNRRFYEPIDTFKKHFEEKGGFLNFRLVESCVISDLDSVERALLRNTVHGIDLIRFIVGEFYLSEDFVSVEGGFFEAKIFSKLQGYTGKITILFGAPANSSIELMKSGEIYLVQPLEILTKFNSIEVNEPSAKNPIRTYKPIWLEETEQIETCKLDFKPGFFRQAVEFKRNQRSINSPLCSVSENYKTLTAITKISNFIKSSVLVS